MADWLAEPQSMQPIGAFANYELPQIATFAELAIWLGIETSELQWFADSKGIAARSIVEQLQHYKKTLLMKHSGSLRLIEAPKLRLKQIQRKVLRHILAAIPAHSAVHGFVRGRSALTFAAAHEQRHTVLRMDVQDFFPSIRAARIAALLRTFGYPESVAETLTGLCTTMTPHLPPNVGTWEARKLYARRHLPQGAPTSPILANLCMYRADCRISALARAADATYTRYADDLAFSGGAAFGAAPAGSRIM